MILWRTLGGIKIESSLNCIFEMNLLNMQCNKNEMSIYEQIDGAKHYLMKILLSYAVVNR